MKIQSNILFMIIVLHINIVVFQGTMVLITFQKSWNPLEFGAFWNQLVISVLLISIDGI
jgi:hypothetical protein